jgi:hypothetical protein
MDKEQLIKTLGILSAKMYYNNNPTLNDWIAIHKVIGLMLQVEVCNRDGIACDVSPLIAVQALEMDSKKIQNNLLNF